MSEQKPIPPVDVTLLKAHRHAGRNYKPGQTIKLAPHKADWLIAQKVAQAAAPDAPAPAPVPAPIPTPAAAAAKKKD